MESKKMRRLSIVLVTPLLAGAAKLPAQQAAADTNFRPLEFLVGCCWKGSFPGGTVTDEHCFAWVYGRHFIRDRHVVRGGAPYEGETIYSWDPLAKEVKYMYWGSEGMTMTGSVESNAEELIFPTRYATPTGEVEIRAVWTRVGNDGYRVQQSEKTAAGWKPILTMEMARSKG